MGFEIADDLSPPISQAAATIDVVSTKNPLVKQLDYPNIIMTPESQPKVCGS